MGNFTKYSKHLVGVIFILVGCYLAFLIPVKNTIQNLIAAMLFSFGLTLLSVLLPGNISIKNESISATGKIAFFIFCTYLFYRIIPNSIEYKSIILHFKNSNNETILNSQKESIKIDFGKNSKKCDINSDGKIIFEIPSNIETIDVELLLNEYQFASTKNKIYKVKISEEIIPIVIEPDFSRCCIYGVVEIEDKKENIFSEIIVSAEGITGSVKENGEFSLMLPENKQLAHVVEVKAYNNIYYGSAYANTTQSINLKLHRKVYK